MSHWIILVRPFLFLSFLKPAKAGKEAEMRMEYFECEDCMFSHFESEIGSSGGEVLCLVVPDTAVGAWDGIIRGEIPDWCPIGQSIAPGSIYDLEKQYEMVPVASRPPWGEWLKQQVELVKTERK